MNELVSNIVFAGASSAVFAYALIQLIVKPALIRREAEWWHPLAVNVATLAFGEAAAFALMFVSLALGNQQDIVRTILIGIIGATVATFGYEFLKNWMARNAPMVNIESMDSVTIGDIRDAHGVVVGDNAEARAE